MFTFSFTCAHLNDLFSQELAEKHHAGEETADNHRYHWEDELEVQEVLAVNITEDGAYSLRGTLGSGTDFSYEIGRVTLIKLTLLAGKEVQFAISNQLLNSIKQTNDAERQHIRVELKDNEPFINPIPGVYIANHDVPNELLTHAPD
ncbi:MAG: hypothetical protein K9I97_01520 [Cryomorphaceae bacterium]|jgi:hypothetical protein|nr:hypothetical protein [Cryomorphaceae bacterium]